MNKSTREASTDFTSGLRHGGVTFTDIRTLFIFVRMSLNCAGSRTSLLTELVYLFLVVAAMAAAVYEQSTQ